MTLVTQPTARLLDAATAAAFLGIGERAFDKQWRSGSVPAPHRLGRRLLWDRRLLDQFVDRLSGLSNPPPKPPTKRKWTK